MSLVEYTSGMLEQLSSSPGLNIISLLYFRPPIQVTNRTANHSAVQSRQPVRKSGGSVWKMIRLLLLLAVLAAVLYYAYCHVINVDNPSGDSMI